MDTDAGGVVVDGIRRHLRGCRGGRGAWTVNAGCGCSNDGCRRRQLAVALTTISLVPLAMIKPMAARATVTRWSLASKFSMMSDRAVAGKAR